MENVGEYTSPMDPSWVVYCCQVKAMRVSRCVDVAAGSRHTLAITERWGPRDPMGGSRVPGMVFFFYLERIDGKPPTPKFGGSEV